jgi:hypothetical protein
MADPRDELDAWLNAQVPPLPPPPGTFELIRKRARRRKMTRAVAAAAGAAAVIAVVATVPRLVITQLHVGPGPAASGQAAGQTSSVGPHKHHPTPSVTPSATPSTASPATAPPPLVPPNFAATSVTFVGANTGYVIGQAGTPGHCGPPSPDICTSMAGTSDAGSTWHGVNPPVTGPPDGSSGVSQVRFHDTSDGWAFGPGLWATHDGGQTWNEVSTGGRRVLALETAGQRVFAVRARCTGTGRAWAAGCTSATLYSTAPGSDQWAPVPGVDTLSGAAGTASAALVLTGTRGYLLAPDGVLYRGPVDNAGAWQAVSAIVSGGTASASPGAAPCAPGAAQSDGQPAAALLAATTSPGGLVLVCASPAAGGSQQKAVYTSADSGKTWLRAGQAPAAGTATSVAGTTAGTIVLATTEGIQVSTDGGTSWSPAQGPLPSDGFAYVGMTEPRQGVAVPADPSVHAVWFTYDGGMTWQESPIG